METSQIDMILALKCCEKQQLIPQGCLQPGSPPRLEGKAAQIPEVGWNRTSVGHLEGARGGVQTATPGLKDTVRGRRLKDTVRGRRPPIFMHKVSQYVRHLINIKGNGWPRFSLVNVKFW